MISLKQQRNQGLEGIGEPEEAEIGVGVPELVVSELGVVGEVAFSEAVYRNEDPLDLGTDHFRRYIRIKKAMKTARF